MKIAVINTGDELLNGSTVNSNFTALGQALTAAGIPIELGFVAGDRPQSLYEALGDALHRADCVIVTGGLGGTRDDVTLECVARFFGWELAEQPGLRRKVEQFWYSRHPNATHVPTAVLRQALVPSGAEILENDNGSASGYFVRCRYDELDRIVILLPGPPREFLPMLEKELLPRLRSSCAAEQITRGFLVVGHGELQLQRMLERLAVNDPFEIGFCARPEGTRVFFRAATAKIADAAAAAARELIGIDALDVGELELPPEIFRLLRRRNLSLGCAESCTGGMIAATITDYPGVSAFFKGGVVVYSNELKNKLLDVPESLLAEHGAVSAECAGAMLEGTLRNLNCNAALSVTGIAGPDGGTATKPVGLVFIGAAAGAERMVREFHFSGNRNAVREQARAHAFRMLRELLLSLPADQ